MTVTRKKQRSKFKRIVGFETDSSQDDSSTVTFRGSSRKRIRVMENSEQRDSSHEDSEQAGRSRRGAKGSGESSQEDFAQGDMGTSVDPDGAGKLI